MYQLRPTTPATQDGFMEHVLAEKTLPAEVLVQDMMGNIREWLRWQGPLSTEDLIRMQMDITNLLMQRAIHNLVKEGTVVFAPPAVPAAATATATATAVHVDDLAWNTNAVPQDTPPVIPVTRIRMTDGKAKEAADPLVENLLQDVMQQMRNSTPLTAEQQRQIETKCRNDLAPLAAKAKEDDLPKHPLYKTALCREFERNGRCSWGVKCNYAHGRRQLRDGPQRQRLEARDEMRRKNGKCPWVTAGRHCPHGRETCIYAH